MSTPNSCPAYNGFAAPHDDIDACCTCGNKRAEHTTPSMMTVPEIREWVDTLEAGSAVAIDDGGLCLVELDADGKKTGAYLEIGGEPRDEH